MPLRLQHFCGPRATHGPSVNGLLPAQMINDPITTTDDLVSGRGCDGCTMCCKLLSVADLDKPRAVWCPHCNKKSGCKIYPSRPEACRVFHCGFLRINDLDERWRPSVSKIVVNFEIAHNRIAIHVDPDRPDAWRVEPFFGTIRKWSSTAERQGGTLAIWTGNRVTVVTPSLVRDLGPVRDDQFILPIVRRTPQGDQRDFELVEADDPRLHERDV